MASLFTSKIGTIVFTADIGGSAKEYICSSLVLSMRMNALPTATVVIGCGIPIRDAKDKNKNNDAETILSHVMHSIGGNTSFINCAIYEADEHSRVCIFRGCIISASLVYKAGNTTMRAVRLECMNEACKLYCQPFSAYNNRCNSDIVGRLQNQTSKLETGASLAGTYGTMRLDSQDAELICYELGTRLDQRDIATKIAYLSDAIAIMTTRPVNQQSPLQEADLGNILHIRDYIKCSYKLDYKKISINNQTDSEFNLALCARLMNSLESGSVLDAIVSAMVSPDYMMTMVPGWGGNFYMYLRPSKAWEPSTNLNIHFGDIFEFNSTYSPLAHINDPEVFAVDFSPALDHGSPKKENGDPMSSIVGAYSTNPKMAEWLKMRFSTSNLEVSKRLELVNNMANLKWREFPAPTWLRTSMLRAKENGKGSQQNSVESQRTLKGVNDTVPVPAVVKDYQSASNIADLVAKALYAHIHGESATAQLSVLPDMRFGFMGDITLEEHIGEVIHILPNESSDSHLAMSGMLEGVQFEYSAGQSASCKYNIMLSRVRPYDAGEQPIECPLYVKAY